MPDEIRVNRPPQAQPSMAPRSDSPVMSDVRDRMERTGGSKLPWIVLAVVVVVLVVLGVLFRDKLFNNNDGAVLGTQTQKPSGYQAVFLTNGQVYFGKIDDINDQYVKLSDIYYLQVTQPPLQGSQQATATQTQQQQQGQQGQAQPQLSLVKLGNELHGPVDAMQINRDQILFFEDMKEDGKVMQAIREYQKNPPANNQTPPANK